MTMTMTLRERRRDLRRGLPRPRHVALAMLSACVLSASPVASAREQAPAPAPASPQTATAAPAPAPAPAGTLPADVQSTIRKTYGQDGGAVRYVDGSIDLNGDAKPELFVHVVGPMVCGSGGCPTLIFTPAGAGHRLVSTIGLTRPPVRASVRQTRGWRNVIVQVSGGGAKGSDVELAFNGTSYPRNPSVAGKRIPKAAADDAQIVIAAFESFEQTKPLGDAAGVR